ncbi:hypothetical protein N0V95_007717 [Ascochyta clinopodiicola]|nr:hypothetical protein N0V95_007717 [Ascochyta clinopodiicola]
MNLFCLNLNSERWTPSGLVYKEPSILHWYSERKGREQARDEIIDDADEGHDDRIEKSKDTEQSVRNKFAYCKGEYAYNQEQEANSDQEEEPSEMGIGSDSDR